MRRARVHFMVLVLLAGLVLARESNRAPLNRIDQSFADLLGRNNTKHQKAAPVTLVSIDQTCLKEHPWPWTPLDFALFLQAANNFKPSAIAMAEVLSWEKASGKQATKLPQYKQILKENLLKSPRGVLLAAKLGFPEDPQAIPELQEVPLIRCNGDTSQIPEFTAIDSQAEQDFRLSATTGFSNLSPGTQHSVPLLWRYRGQLVPSFVLQAVILWEQVTPAEVSVSLGSNIQVGPKLSIPINERGEMRVNFAVPRGRVSFDDLILASAQADSKIPLTIPRENFDHRLLLLARTDPAARTVDLASGMPGSPGELFAAGIATIQNRAFVHRIGSWFDISFLAVTALLGLWIPGWGRGAVLAGSAVAVVAYTMVALSVFEASQTWLPIVLPAGMAIFIGLYRQICPEPSIG